MGQAVKAENRAAFGWNVFNQDTIHKANIKRLNSLPQRDDEGNVVSDPSLTGYRTSKAAVRELSKDIEAQQEEKEIQSSPSSQPGCRRGLHQRSQRPFQQENRQ